MVKLQETTFAMKFRPVEYFHEVVDSYKQTFFYLFMNEFISKEA